MLFIQVININMTALLLSTLNKTLNAYLQLDPQSKNRLQQLQNKIISFEFLPFHFRFQCEFSQQQVIIHAGHQLPAETTIRGTPLQMLGVMIEKQHRQHFFADDLVIEGHAELGQQTIALFDELDIDWEDYAAHLIGDIPAYHTFRVFRQTKNWFAEVKKTLGQQLNEYIHEELSLAPSPEELQDFFMDIDLLRMDIDRLQARIERLQQHKETP